MEDPTVQSPQIFPMKKFLILQPPWFVYLAYLLHLNIFWSFIQLLQNCQEKN